MNIGAHAFHCDRETAGSPEKTPLTYLEFLCFLLFPALPNVHPGIPAQ